ncbi:MAG TPA: hypothetical protein VES79_10295, partial [Solirubrobacteraceae bacterium]|nr:hypothetical protein [Solirubrobacteraceae bacterium]
MPRVIAGGLAVLVATFAITAVGSAATTTLYVDGGNAGCSNTGQGTSAQPFCTIGAAASKVTAGQ